jgi:hypothetical protein
MMRGPEKSNLLATRSIRILELGIMEATCIGRWRNRLKNKTALMNGFGIVEDRREKGAKSSGERIGCRGKNGK